MRPIDADRMKEELLWGNVFLTSKETNTLVDLIDNQPTLIPQNEPLTIEQLREMDGQPVYIVIDGVEPLKMWVLVEIDGADIYLTNNLGGRSSYEEVRYLYKFKLYRHPPER